MYSKSGKSFEHKFQILLSKNEILSREQHPLPRVKKFNKRLKDLLVKIPQVSLIPEKEEKLRKSGNFIFKASGREKPLEVKKDSPPPGYYNCNYSLILKSPTSCIFRKENKKYPRYLTPTTQNDSYERKTPSNKANMISFKKQIPRREHFVKELNENRFLSFDHMPETCSKYKSIHVPDISKFSERKSIIKSAEFLPSYKPDYRFVKEDLGKVHEFSKYLERKPLFNCESDFKRNEFDLERLEFKLRGKEHLKIYEKLAM
jgi:hypothetical protein